jgi:glycosyltransferase involved in cell wall biosynthesis
MNSLPSLITVIMPIYNGHAFLLEAIASIQRQKGCPLDILIVDDGSTDDTPEAVKALGSGVRSVRQEHGGISAARNTGLRNVQGDWIAFLDSDDLWSDDKLEVQLKYLAADPHLQMISGRGILYRPPGTEWDRDTSAIWTQFVLGSAMFRRDFFEQVGDFDTGQHVGEDTDLFLRAIEKNIPFHLHSEVVLYYRRHANNTTNDLDKLRLGMLHALRRSLERRRMPSGEIIPLGQVTIPESTD